MMLRATRPEGATHHTASELRENPIAFERGAASGGLGSAVALRKTPEYDP